jgi:hypothetical protein
MKSNIYSTIIISSILAVSLIATVGIPSTFVNVLAQDDTGMMGGNDTGMTMNATLAYAERNDTSKPMNATLAFAQDDTGMMGGNDTGMTMNATLLPLSIIGNNTS